SVPERSQQQAANSSANVTPDPGRTTIVKRDDGSLVEKNDKGQVVRTKDAKGEERRYSWSANNELIEVASPFGTWKSTDGRNWVSAHGKTRMCDRGVDQEGNYWEEDEVWRRIYKYDGTQIELHKQGGTVGILFLDGTSILQSQKTGTIHHIRNT